MLRADSPPERRQSGVVYGHGGGIGALWLIHFLTSESQERLQNAHSAIKDSKTPRSSVQE